ncbi:hypothetical protein DL237_16560 [Pseudooceanicola sediminis]|uniref:Uncharacterized protein n=1 Tax=Pseudooceanicola sediminis TaxID=2211117 RepID=A0A399IZ03_9RHOB|nr:hypothetical protein [Pseudooceanicola sediminis]KAA2312490.1 hypothetical protein E0K93_16805 [Puniceibacterium sp. HSS470]RII37499.1 hypothetical protein DL237_16560 [Pseudooceanicola sediminis]|tara:strand:+ start:16584 stop:17333 length:750 start_codon:yes stop_codon:yes gene_type:complete
MSDYLTENRVAIAAANNADLCQAIFDAHGLAYRRLPENHCLAVLQTPPPFYPNLVTLSAGDAGAQLAELTAIAALTPGPLVVKDSFARFDLSYHDFHVNQKADWIWRAPQLPEADTDPATTGWRRVETADDLAAWERAWADTGTPRDHQVFPPALLDHPDISIHARTEEGRITAGCLLNHSESCIGLSNIFALDPTDRLVGQIAALATQLAPHKPLVGYEAGDALARMLRIGFASVGPLKIWRAEAPRF